MGKNTRTGNRVSGKSAVDEGYISGRRDWANITLVAGLMTMYIAALFTAIFYSL